MPDDTINAILDGSIDRDTGIEVAQTAEEKYPQQAIEVYQRYVEMLIEWRGRDYYHTACQYLLSIRNLSKTKAKEGAGYRRHPFQAFLAALEKVNRS